ncbi:DUF1493 family protein [Pelagibius sp. Alg239-R121]|uniref:DUF1493 family protein n=1 Tax=Pelagibius sp. Alg239-R121 TaxID=2993448 RepID=UPI0024A63D3A|nr:DUF1493 family protein [Pelagibius sp. Alg239-R121]
MNRISDEEALLELISEELAIKRDRLRDETTLCRELGVAGLDGAELLEAIGKRFGIDVSEVEWWRYFGPEVGYDPIRHLLAVLSSKNLTEDIVTLRISDLKRIVAAGKWIESIG